jgi:hypothetical protein
VKTLIFIFILCSSLVAIPDCYKEYSSVIEKLEKIYKKDQYQHSRAFNDRYKYEIFPTTMFPLFCVPSDSVKKLASYKTIYLCNTTIGLYTDKANLKHLQVAVLHYITVGKNIPWIKTYTMFFYKFDSITKDWLEERPPVKVVFTYKNGYYLSK